MLVRLYNSILKPLLMSESRGLWQSVTFPNRQSHPLYTVIGQACGGVIGLFHLCVNKRSSTPWMLLRRISHLIQDSWHRDHKDRFSNEIRLWDAVKKNRWLQAFHPTFECSLSEQVETFVFRNGQMTCHTTFFVWRYWGICTQWPETQRNLFSFGPDNCYTCTLMHL